MSLKKSMTYNMEKFSKILEASGNVHQKGTPFSNGHRSRTYGDGFLLGRHQMIDVDEVIFDDSGNIFGIIENKFQQPRPGSKLKNIITENTSQKSALLKLCSSLDGFLFVNIESEKSYYYFKSNQYSKIYPEREFLNGLKDKNLHRVKTDNGIFIEFRMSGDDVILKSVNLRNHPELINTAKAISSKLNLPLLQIEDSGPTIKFTYNGKYIDEVKSVLFPENSSPDERIELQQKWESIYKRMNLFE